MADKIELYERRSNTDSWSVRTTGDTLPLSKRSIQTAEMALKLSEYGNMQTERYIRLGQPSSVSHSIDVWDEGEFAQSINFRFQIQLLLFGFCCAMIAFNFVVALVTRAKLFAFNAATISSTMLIAIYMNGQGSYLLWPENPELSFTILVLGMGGLSLFATQFVSAFLENGSVKPSWLSANRWFGAAQFTIALIVIISGASWLYAILLLVGLLSMAVQLFLVLVSIGRGDRQSIPILIPLSILIAGICLRWARTAFSIDFGWANYHMMEIAMALEAITFSLILAARIRYFASKASEIETQLGKVKLETANRFARLQDAERERMATDLHDSLGHSLAMVNAQLSRAQSEGPLAGGLADRIAHSRIALREAISETRRISHDLHPAKLDHLGLKDTLKGLLDELTILHPIQTKADLNFPEEVLDAATKVQIYRIVQEAISNVVKHSGAKYCELSIHWYQDTLSFRFADDGCGLSEDGQNGLGFLSMSQRVILLGSDLQFQNSKAGGLVVEFSLDRSMAEQNT